ncbi:hypothetical protein GCM10023144_35420 [Pigmentiphaga soli]|uniref:SMP-30/Gluconolactonase/LRE-like region domain-containing protein n=1 Tax=Pigmentiphaga soli TaxID=1007095 RepID=A0ABP8HF05_9BURK
MSSPSLPFLDPAACGWIGHGLVRPECVLATRTAGLFTADWRGGVAHLRPDGSQALYRAQPVDGEALKPNGIALRADGSFLLAHLGDGRGGVFELRRDGATRPLLTAVDGSDLPPTNFVHEDAAGRIWISVSTRLRPRALGYRAGCEDGFIVLLDRRGARIVADGLGYANEVALDPGGQWLYVNETFGRRLSRFRLLPGGDLGPRETVAVFGEGTFPDGLCFDAEGGAWVTSIVSNRLLRVAPDGSTRQWMEDADAAWLARVEQAFRGDAMGREHLDKVRSRRLRSTSSLAFGGEDLRTGYIGCLLGDAIAVVAMPVAGIPPVHWNYS